MFRCWGKANDPQDGRPGAPRPHPLPCHCLDVAAVADALLHADPHLAARAAALSPLPAGPTISLLVFFAAVHDLGKFTLPFQWQVPELARAAGLAPWNAGTRQRHTALALAVWGPLRTRVALACGFPDADTLGPLEQAAFGHHGQPVDTGDRPPPGCDKGLADLAAQFVDQAYALFLRGELPGFTPLAPAPDLSPELGPEPSPEQAPGSSPDSSPELPPDPAPELDECSLRPLSWLAAGLFVLADWIGSNNIWFPARPEARDLRAYWDEAAARAREALPRTGVLPAAHSRAAAFHDLLPHIDAQHAPHPMQRAVLDLPAQTGPELLILEDVTGGGKTEAAVLAAHRTMRAGLAAGLFVGLPTMATANAMYARLAASYRALFDDPEASLILAHSGRARHEGYLASIGLEAAPGAAPVRGAARSDAPDEPAEAVCAAWLADNRKKALLAPCGAGTLDQALLAVLPSRHQSLRLLGLARSVLVADEVHAFDEYTGRLLEALLTFHAALGGSAVLLSATMPLALRERLVAAWRLGRRLSRGEVREPWGFLRQLEAPEPEEAAPERTEFPLLTRATDEALEETPVAPARGLDVETVLVHDEADMFRALAAAQRAGACACWVRNTVDDAVAARERLTAEFGLPGEAVDLFHARFAGGDRRRIETRVLARFGKDSRPEERAGRILVATQVVEQSLDLDFDLMLSDLAPMELLIQRAGRCHRHMRGAGQAERPEGYRTARLLVLSPPPAPDPPEDWYAALFDKGQYVYPRHGSLWLTARLLADKGRLRLPEDARELVEGAYADDAPEAFWERDDKVLGKDCGHRAQAELAALRFKHGYCTGDGMQWDRDFRTPTRLGDDTQQVRLVRCEDGRARLWAAREPDDASMAACLDSELRVAVRRLREPLTPAGWGADLDALREAMPDQGRWRLLLPLFPDDAGGWTGRGLDAKGEEVEVGYDEGRGMLFGAQETDQ